ncbi:MAG TPA: LysM peptidoglycan-binding domain-containing protein [Cytophagaceae bacterium]|nr:LysM peptidoglycan-binding domain-containing protein [Cytophagaceae bacterium]
MIAKLRFIFLFLLFGTTLFAQQVPVIEVPDEIEFAGMQLVLTKEAKEILQKDIALISQSKKFYQTKVNRSNLYFPLIEKVFEEESFPKDFKFLALQESSLICDAVSKSNAVGYWQFKKESAVEVGLRVDDRIDERMNIVSSSRGATRYLKRNNQLFDNWIYALLSYNLGLGGAKSTINTNNIGARKMTLDENTHWYVIRFLAHKLAFQHAIGNAASVDSVLVPYINGGGKTIDEIAKEFNLDPERTASYNKWLKWGTVPTDKIYTVILPMPIAQANKFVQPDPADEKTITYKKEKFATVADVNVLNASGAIVYTYVINGVEAILARNGDHIVSLATKGKISKDEFLRYNELRSFDDVIPGKIYYLKHKKNKAMVMFHTVQYNETLWDIAQNYGMKSEVIREKNRMDENEAITPGRVLWLRSKRPKNRPVEYKAVEPAKPIIKETPPPPVVIDSASLKPKTQELKPTDNIFQHYDTKVKPFVIDSTQYSYTFHEVITGETLFGISKKYQVTTDSLMRWNNLEGYTIKLGQMMVVGYKSKDPEPMTYTVMTGDTFYKIAHQYNVTVGELQQWNNKTDMNLKVGEKLFIKKNQH